MYIMRNLKEMTLQFRAKDISNIIKNICSGMIYLHSNSIIHRDLKPSNILVELNAKGRIKNIKITDFGHAKAIKNEMLLKTKARGTPEYMAPEIREGDDYYAEKVDVYSFGVILWALVKCKEPDYERNERIPAPDKTIMWLKQKLKGFDTSIGFGYHEFIGLTKICISHNPESRPDFPNILKKLNQISFGV